METKVVSVYMYTLYKDIYPGDSFSSDEMQNMQKEQKKRDQILFAKMQKNNIPLFPMEYKTFIKYKSNLENLSKDDQRLNILFVINQKKYLIMNSGNIKIYESKDESFRSIYDITLNNTIICHPNKIF
jgi:hypothetical protein